MQRVTLLGVDHAVIEAAVGPASYARGLDYARRGMVVRTRWNATEFALQGTVLGRGALYETTAYFEELGDGSYDFMHGECSCPVGFDCKHVVALIVSAAPTGTPARSRPAKARKTPSWETSLGSLLDSRPAEPANQPNGIPLAIELTLSATARRRDGASTTVQARLVQPGRRGWTVGNLSWTKLGTLFFGGYLPSHLRVLQELYALYRARETTPGYYNYGDVKTIDFTAFESRHLWPILNEAEAVGIRLVQARALGGDVGRTGAARISLDVTESPESLEIAPVVELDGKAAEVTPLRFIGAEAHGLIYADRAETEASPDPTTWHLHLAELANRATPQVQQMVLANELLRIPAKEATRFRAEFYPRLRHIAPVTSSDGSFTPPVISAPTLTLQASYGDGHALELSWMWTYQVGDAVQQAPLDPAGADGYRDLAQERAVLAGLDVPLEEFGLAGDDRTMPAPHRVLKGLDTMRFTTEVLPLLRDRPDVAVELDGSPADYREAGDSLSISVSTAEIAGEHDWFDLGVTISVEGREVPFTQVFTALAGGRPHLLLDDGAYFSLEKPELRKLRELILEARALQEDPREPLKISRYQVGLWDELAALGVVGRQAEVWQRQLKALRSIETVDVVEPPETLKAQLRPYQLDGFRWLGFLWKFRLGGILADDMGLGKTLQSLALICHAKAEEPDLPPFLIIAPTSVVPNWAAEAARFAPGLSVAAISDTAKRRGSPLAEFAGGADVVVTSHTLFRIEFDDYAALPWAGLIMDEAQFAKNHHSKIYQCARRLGAPLKLAITGTPMENNLMELWSLLSITAPGLFPNPDRFAEFYARPIEKQGDTELLDRLRRRIKPLITRRTKEQVAADLPPKQEQVLEVELPPRHRKIYQTYLQRERQKVLGLIDDMNRNRFTILRSLTLLRQLSLHAGLVDEQYRNFPCAKVDALLEQLSDVVEGGHRALVFSQFTGFLDVVRQRLEASNVDYCYLDGKTRKRAAVLDRFKNGDAPVFLISLKAGGFGLNLTEADYCFLLDPWWNPATEAQAVDRTHRIGQTRNVMVYRLIAKGTIEEKVMELKARKAKLFTSVMDDGDMFATSLGADDIRGLFA